MNNEFNIHVLSKWELIIFYKLGMFIQGFFFFNLTKFRVHYSEK